MGFVQVNPIANVLDPVDMRTVSIIVGFIIVFLFSTFNPYLMERAHTFLFMCTAYGNLSFFAGRHAKNLLTGHMMLVLFLLTHWHCNNGGCLVSQTLAAVKKEPLDRVWQQSDDVYYLGMYALLSVSALSLRYHST